MVKLKRLLVALLCVAVTTSILSALGEKKTKAYALRTQAEAVAWITARENEKWAKDYDGAYGAQCVDLIVYYWEWLTGTRPNGNGKDYANKTLPSGWYYTNSPQPGDIAVWTNSTWGHVALVKSVDGNYFNLIDIQGTTGQFGSHRYTINNPQTYIHPDFAPEYNNLKIEGVLDGVTSNSTEGFGTFDVYINGNLEAQGVSSFAKTDVARGSSYSIENIKMSNGKTYAGIAYGSRAGAISGNTTVGLKFNSILEDMGEVTTTKKIWNEHTYIYVPRSSTWYEARYYCEKMGGHLVTINSKEEEQFVSELGGNKDIWVGATDAGSEGVWHWITGEAFSYSRWNSGEPNNGTGNDEGQENYLNLVENSNGAMNDSAGCRLLYFICEIDSALEITANPSDTTVPLGDIAYLSVKASGKNLKYLWQYKAAGSSTWTDWTTKTTASISVAYADYRNGMSFRCVVTDSEGNKVISDPAVLKYKQVITITTQPSDIIVNEGETAYFDVGAKGVGLKYLWQYKEKGKATWTDWTTKTTAVISVAYAEYRDGMSLRCVITDSVGNKEISNAAVLTYKFKSYLAITTQPKSATVNDNEIANFSVTATGKGLKYLWQYKEAGKSTWTDWTTKTTASISVAYAAYRNGMSLRCVVSDATGAKLTTNTVTLTYVTPLVITKQPVNTTVYEQELAYFEVKATGKGLKYLWQYKEAGKSTWTDWTTKTTAKISVAYAAYRNGMSFRCVVTDSYGKKLTSNAVTLKYTVNNNLFIITQPKSTSVNKKSIAYFSIKANGVGLKYQWQYKNAGDSSWTVWSSKTTADISVAYADYRNGMSLKCIVTDSKGNMVVSDTVTLSYK